MARRTSTSPTSPAPVADDTATAVADDQTIDTAPVVDDQTSPAPADDTAPVADDDGPTVAPADDGPNPAAIVTTAARAYVLDGGPLADVHGAMLNVDRNDRSTLAGTILAGLAVPPVAVMTDPAALDAYGARVADLAPALLNPARQSADPAVSAALALSALHVAMLAVSAALPDDVARGRAADLLALAVDGGPAATDLDAILSAAAVAVRAAGRAGGTSTRGQGQGGPGAPRVARVQTVPVVGTVLDWTYNGQTGQVRYDGPGQFVTLPDQKVHKSATAAMRAATGAKSLNGAKYLGLV
jgi:hypothetical protein